MAAAAGPLSACFSGRDLQRSKDCVPSLQCTLPSCNSRLLELFWTVPDQKQRSCKPGRARIVCIGGPDKNAREAARKALENALGEKKEVFSKWDEEIRRKETNETRSSGGGGGRKRGGGGGSGGGGRGGRGRGGRNGRNHDPREESSWEEAKQIVFAFGGLLAFYLLMTNGKSSLIILMSVPRVLMKGGKKGVGGLIALPLFMLRAAIRQQQANQRRQYSPTPAAVTCAVDENCGGGGGGGGCGGGGGAAAGDDAAPATAQSHVMSKWGRD